MVMAAPPTEDSAVSPCFHGRLAFLNRHFPPQSPPSHPLDPFLHNQQQPSPWDCSTIPKLQLPASAPSRRPAFLPGGMYGCGKDCLILIPFRLPQISYHLLSALKVSPDSDNRPSVGIGSLLQFPHPPRAGPVLLTLLFSPLLLLFYILFSTGQVLLSALSWCSACTSVSEGVFLMYPWREMLLHIHLLLCHLVHPLSLLFNMLSRLVIAFLPSSKHLLISWLQSPSAVILEHKISKFSKISDFRK